MGGLFGRQGLQHYIDEGYLPRSRSDDEAVTRSLNYYIADAAIAQAATLLGHSEDANILNQRSLRWPVLFNNETKFFQPKGIDGNFDEGFDPLAWRRGFTEGGAWQQRFDVPHDVSGLAERFEGGLCDAIREMLTKTTGDAFHVGGYWYVIHEMEEAKATQPEFGLYNHGNQPVHQVLWLAKKAGCHELADKYLRKVMSTLYTVHGWAGDEDNGEMAAWYVLSSLGIFQLEGAKDELVLGSPAVVRATVALPAGKKLQIETENQAESHVYVQKVQWTATGCTPREIKDSTLKYTELMGGGELTFTLGPQPLPDQAFYP